MNKFKKLSLIGWMLAIPLFVFSNEANQHKEVDDIAHQKKKNVELKKPFSFADEAVGVMDKGQLQNLTMNYGQITDTRYEDVGNAPSQYFYDFSTPEKITPG